MDIIFLFNVPRKITVIYSFLQQITGSVLSGSSSGLWRLECYLCKDMIQYICYNGSLSIPFSLLRTITRNSLHFLKLQTHISHNNLRGKCIQSVNVNFTKSLKDLIISFIKLYLCI